MRAGTTSRTQVIVQEEQEQGSLRPRQEQQREPLLLLLNTRQHQDGRYSGEHEDLDIDRDGDGDGAGRVIRNADNEHDDAVEVDDVSVSLQGRAHRGTAQESGVSRTLCTLLLGFAAG